MNKLIVVFSCVVYACCIYLDYSSHLVQAAVVPEDYLKEVDKIAKSIPKDDIRKLIRLVTNKALGDAIKNLKPDEVAGLIADLENDGKPAIEEVDATALTVVHEDYPEEAEKIAKSITKEDILKFVIQALPEKTLGDTFKYLKPDQVAGIIADPENDGEPATEGANATALTVSDLIDNADLYQFLGIEPRD